MKHLNTLLAALLMLSGIAFAGETGTALKSDTLRKEPYADAKAVGTLKRNDKIEILTKKGAWLQIKAGKSTGWVRLLSVKRGTQGSSNEAAGILGLATGRSGTGQVVSTTGVRGLNEEELKDAKFNEEEMKQLEASTISAEDGKTFVTAGGLKARKLDYLPQPQPTKGSAQ
ncbi:ligand-binding protein SH3 [Methylobacillus sp. MM3]|jgi:uncharacterized protein YgiM (DUF1202 family)|uniref:SH3 domain-containing protein n=1 Tax=Methylobacillus sp. MM3 TaxID=1848039 RepID=UPI0007DE9C66|nr:SH3 domain-containing protein [Methylobacillus sp. MM3]OAJ71226.1 ligand-binding protein SH3 [Methylobacillus sp. MM3]